MWRATLSANLRVITALWFWALVNYLDRVAISFAGPQIMQSLSLTPGEFGLILSSFGVGYLLAQIPGGIAADRWGARLILICGPLFWALFTGLTGLVTTLGAFIAVRILFGLSEGFSVPSIHRLVGDHFPSRDRARAMAIILTALAIAPAVTGPFVGVLVAKLGWQTMFFMLTLPALMASFVCLVLVPPRRRALPVADEQETARDHSFLAVLGERSFWLMAISYLCYNIGFWGYIGWMPSYLALAHQIDLKAAGPIAGIPYIFAFLGLLVWGWLGSGPFQHRRPQLIGCSVLLAGISLFLAFQAETLVQSVAGLSCAAFFLYGCQGSLGAVIIDLAPPSFRGTYTGTVSTVGQIGGLVAPGIVGLLVSQFGSFASGFTFMTVALCVSAAAMLALTPYARAATHPIGKDAV